MKRIMGGFLVLIFLCSCLYPQTPAIPSYLKHDDQLSSQLSTITWYLDLDEDFDVGDDGIEQISLAVIDLTQDPPRIGGVNMDNFIYPASVYKIYVAAEVLNQISQGLYSPDSLMVVKSPNDVQRSVAFESDKRPVLKDGDTVSVAYLLDLMISRSDNSAANCLIDLAGRENINKLLHEYGWQGSEVTRKFLSRKYEDPGYEDIRGTETCALHAADFLYLIHARKLVNPWVSMQMESFLSRQLDRSKFYSGLPPNTMYYNKTGWFSYWTHDVGIVDNGTVRYIVACFIPIRQEQALAKYAELSGIIHDFLYRKSGCGKSGH